MSFEIVELTYTPKKTDFKFHIFSKVTNQEPDFEVTLLDKGTGDGDVSDVRGIKLFVFAQNAKGSSEPFIIEETLRHLKHSKHAVEGEREKYLLFT